MQRHLNGKHNTPVKYAKAEARHKITSFETGVMTLPTWAPYKEQVLDFLQERDAPPGNYSVRVNRRVRSALAPGEVRLRPFQRNAIVLLCRPDGMDNGGIYEILIIGEFKDWNSRDMHFYFEKFDAPAIPDEEPETMNEQSAVPENIDPVVTAVPEATAPGSITPPGPKLSLSEKLARLERIANRSAARDLILKEIETKMTTAKKELADLEARYLQVLQEIEADAECRNAAEGLKALERLLGE